MDGGTFRAPTLDLRLSDGTPVVARPLTPADRPYLAEGYRRLSPEARYQRFWVKGGEVIGDAMLDRLLNAQLPEHAIWTVYDPVRTDFPGLGAASFWRSGEDPVEAEVSATVLDSEQGRGVGTLLLAILWLVAYRHGIGRFVGYTMPENLRALRWMRATGAEAEWDGYNVICRWDLANLQAIPATHGGAELAARLAELSEMLLETGSGEVES